MSRKTAAQKARAAAAAEPKETNKDVTIKTVQQSKKTQHDAKRIKLTHDGGALPSKEHTDDIPGTSGDVVSDISRRQPGHPRPKPPEPPASIPSTTVILPPEADDPKLRERHDLHFIGVAGNSKMESKIQQALTALQSKATEGKSVLVAFTAPSRAANKCVGITEITKREILKDQSMKKVYQYTGCWSRLETHTTKDQQKATAKTSRGVSKTIDAEATEEVQMDDEDGDDAFETAASSERKQVRNAACLVVYLSMAPVARLREKYGEQIHEREAG